MLWLPLGWRVGDRQKIRYSHLPSCCRSPSRRHRLSLCRSPRSRRRRLRGLSPPLVRRRRITPFCRWFTMSSNGKGLGKVKTPLFAASGVRGSELPKPVRSGPRPIFPEGPHSRFESYTLLVGEAHILITCIGSAEPCSWSHPRFFSGLGMGLKSLHT